MTSRRFITCIFGLMFVAASCAAAAAQTPGTAAPVVTEARCREILQAAEALTSEAFSDVLRRAEAGDVEAQVLAGIALEDGKVAPKDLNKAVYWIRSGAENNHPFAQNRLGWYYETGTGVPQDSQKAVEWYIRAAAQGYAQAQSNLGLAYVTGRGAKKNPGEAVRLFRLAAEQGNTDGQFFLGVAYEDGIGVRKDKDEAAKWYRKSSQQGNAIASFYYGWLNLAKPKPGMTDPLATRAAVDGLQLSAEQGYPVAAFVLGEVFSYRLFPYHLRKDELEACSWYVIASNLDKRADWGIEQPEPVAHMRKNLPERMSKVRKSLGVANSEECERRASDWITTHPPRRQE